MNENLFTAAEIASRLVQVEDNGDSAYRLRQVRNWQNLGFLDAVTRKGHGPKAAALFSEVAIFKARLFVILTSMGFDATRIREVNRDLIHSDYFAEDDELPPSVRGAVSHGVIADAVRGIRSGERWHYQIDFSAENEIHSGPVWPDHPLKSDEAVRLAQDYGLAGVKPKAVVRVVIDLNELFAPLLDA